MTKAESGGQLSSQQVQEGAPKIRTSKRKAKKTYDTEPTVYTQEHARFGEVRIRKDWGSAPDIDPVDVAKFVKACLEYAKRKGKRDKLNDEMVPYAEEIKVLADKYPGLRGIESEKYDTTITDVLENPFSSENADVIKIREHSGISFPQFGKEIIVFTVTVPEEEIETTQKRIDPEKLIENFNLLMIFHGMDEDSRRTNVDTKRKLAITDRERYIELINDGVVPLDISGFSTGRRLVVEPLRKTPESKNGENGNGEPTA